MGSAPYNILVYQRGDRHKCIYVLGDLPLPAVTLEIGSVPAKGWDRSSGVSDSIRLCLVERLWLATSGLLHFLELLNSSRPDNTHIHTPK